MRLTITAALLSFAFVGALVFLLGAPFAYAATTHEGAAKAEPGEKALASAGDDARRSPEGVVSVVNTTSNNPYNKQLRLYIDVGAEFADFDGSEISEGYIVNCGAGDIITLPIVKAKPGYTFVGWGQGGVPDEIEWDVFVREVKMTDEISEGDEQTGIYALYMNDDGDGYCTCGSYKAGVYEDQVDELKEKYEQYRDEYGDGGTQNRAPSPVSRLISLVVVTLMGCAFVVPVLVASRRGRSDA